MFIIDRFEGDYAVIEGKDQLIFTLPKTLVPTAQVGDVLHFTISIDIEETNKRKKAASKLLNHFFDE